MNSTAKKTVMGVAAIAAVGLVGGYMYLGGGSEKPRVLFIDSYHEGYEWSDGITAGIQRVVANADVDLRIHRMDTKRNKSEAYMQNAALKAKALIEEYRPDVVIATDDNAQKYLVVPYYKDGPLPFVFAGVNWDASQYGYPASNVTGMVEVDSAVELVETLANLSGGTTAGFLSSDTNTSKKVLKSYQEQLDIEFEEVALVGTYEAWKQAYLDLQNKVDMIIMYNNSGIDGWDKEDAARFATENAQVPSGATQSWMAPYVLLLFTKDAVEQGEYAAETALRILEGNSPGSMPITRNQRVLPQVNSEIARRLRINIPPELMSEAARAL